MKRICVFCGSAPGASPRFLEAAKAMGTCLAQKGMGLVYGGGSVGLMGAVADAALAAGAEVVGVIPAALASREIAHQGLTTLHVVDTMHERKALMADLADGFVALPGGMGTLDELAEALSWAQLGIHGKPCGLLDVEGFWAHLLSWMDQAVQARFLRPDQRALLLVDDEADRLLTRMLAHQPRPVQAKWLDRRQR